MKKYIGSLTRLQYITLQFISFIFGLIVGALVLLIYELAVLS